MNPIFPANSVNVRGKLNVIPKQAIKIPSNISYLI